MSSNIFKEALERETTKDNINPNHYKVGGLETIDIYEAKMSTQQFMGFLMGNILKYVIRHEHKNGLEDLKKAQWYLNKMISTYEKGD
jgi:hypothetical protein